VIDHPDPVICGNVRGFKVADTAAAGPRSNSCPLRDFEIGTEPLFNHLKHHFDWTKADYFDQLDAHRNHFGVETVIRDGRTSDLTRLISRPFDLMLEPRLLFGLLGELKFKGAVFVDQSPAMEFRFFELLFETFVGVATFFSRAVEASNCFS